jgi:hypothetical protein
MKTLWLKVAVLGLLAAGASGAAGCNALGFIAAKTAQFWTPEEEVEAQYNISGKSVLVLVDTKDPAKASEFPRLQAILSEAINKVLTEHKACPQTVSTRSVEALRTTEPQFDTWSVTRIGKYFNVDLVLYVEVLDFRLKDEPTSNVYHGYAEGTVRLVSPETGEQIWPVLSSARLVSAETMPGVEAESSDEQQSIIIDGYGEKIARMFFTYQKEEIPLHRKVR